MPIVGIVAVVVGIRIVAVAPIQIPEFMFGSLDDGERMWLVPI